MRRPLLGAVLGLLLLAGCSSGGGDDTAAAGTTTATAAPTTAPTTTPTTTSPGASSAAAPAGTGCPATTGALPAGATTAPTIDVDGDGRPDTAYVASGSDGGVVFGVQTASGADFSAPFDSASPVTRSVLVADVTGAGEVVALASDGRAVQLWAVSDCSLVPVQNAQGQPYTFDLGFTGFGTGVGCADVDGDGARDLVGLLADGTSVTSTVVDLTGPQARNGASSTIADATPQQRDAAHQVTCGDRLLAADGVTLAP